MNNHGAMTVERCGTNEIRHVCEYGTPDLRRRLGLLSAGTEVLLSMCRIGVRANVWRAVGGVEPRSVETAETGAEERVKQPL